MRVLAMSTPNPTHALPMVPLLWALRAAGHEVIFAGQPDVVGTARAAGIPAVTVGHLFDAYEFFSGLPADRRPIEVGLGGHTPLAEWKNAAVPWVLHAKYLVDPYLELARQWRPDLIVSDPLEISSIIVGALLGVPTVHHRWGLEYLSTAALDLARGMLHNRCVRMGLPEGFPGAPTVFLDPLPASLSIPEVTAGRPIRPVPYNAGGQVPLDLLGPPQRPRICVTFGTATVRLNGLPLVRHVIDAFDGVDDLEAVVTVDPADWDRIGLVPKTVRLVGHTPLVSILPDCTAILHHAGTGSALSALVAGLPQLILPQISDQAMRAEGLRAAGVAITLDEADQQNDPDTVRDALQRLRTEPSFAEAAAGLRAAIEAMPAPADVALDLETLALDFRSRR